MSLLRVHLTINLRNKTARHLKYVRVTLRFNTMSALLNVNVAIGGTKKS